MFIGSLRWRRRLHRRSGLPASLQLSPLHTLPHHSCSTLPPRACLALHAKTGAWALIVECSHKSDRYPCLQRVHVSFSPRFISLRDLHEPSLLSCALAWNPLHTPRALLSWTCQHDWAQHLCVLSFLFVAKNNYNIFVKHKRKQSTICTNYAQRWPCLPPYQ